LIIYIKLQRLGRGKRDTEDKLTENSFKNVGLGNTKQTSHPSFYNKKKNWFVLSLVVEFDEMAGQVLLIIKYSLFLNLS
jgi:hypothetical protein